MPTKRTTISMPPDLFDQAMERQRDFNYPTFSDYVQSLIRVDVTKRPNAHIREAAPPADLPTKSTPVKYPPLRRKPRK